MEDVSKATKTLQDRQKVGNMMKDMIKSRIQANNLPKPFAREIEAIGIVHGKLMGDFYTLDLPFGSVARLFCHDQCFVPVHNMNVDEPINISEMLAIIVNVLRHKRRLERSMAITRKATPIAPSTHLLGILSKKNNTEPGGDQRKCHSPTNVVDTYQKKLVSGSFGHGELQDKKDYTKKFPENALLGTLSLSTTYGSVLLFRTKLTHPRHVINVATFKESEGPNCTTVRIVRL
ncbi:hypothetical protein G9A89_015419 [Geosiphon pyriformis]|nr:hypothetical protein G9A89_015419 [Geosiphon pyriformis]